MPLLKHLYVPLPQSKETDPEDFLQSLLCLRAEVRSSTSDDFCTKAPQAAHRTLHTAEGGLQLHGNPQLIFHLLSHFAGLSIIHFTCPFIPLEHIKGRSLGSLGRCPLGAGGDGGG